MSLKFDVRTMDTSISPDLAAIVLSGQVCVESKAQRRKASGRGPVCKQTASFPGRSTRDGAGFQDGYGVDRGDIGPVMCEIVRSRAANDAAT